MQKHSLTRAVGLLLWTSHESAAAAAARGRHTLDVQPEVVLVALRFCQVVQIVLDGVYLRHKKDIL